MDDEAGSWVVGIAFEVWFMLLILNNDTPALLVFIRIYLMLGSEPLASKSILLPAGSFNVCEIFTKLENTWWLPATSLRSRSRYLLEGFNDWLLLGWRRTRSLPWPWGMKDGVLRREKETPAMLGKFVSTSVFPSVTTFSGLLNE